MTKRVVGASVVLVAAIVACMSAIVSTERQYSLATQCGTGPCGTPAYDFGTQPLNTTVFTMPGSDSYFVLSDATQSDLITSIKRDALCSPDFQLILPPPGDSYGDTFGSSVMIGCTSGGGGCGASGTTCTDSPTYSFGAAFTPTHSFHQSCLVHVDFTNSVSGPGSATLELDGSGSAQTFDMQITQPTVDPYPFGSVPTMTSSAAVSVVLQNTGNSQLNVGASLGGANVNEFTVIPSVPANFTLSPFGMAGDTATFKVACAPSTTGNFMATLTFTTGATEGNLSQSASFTCTGITTGVKMTPNAFDFGKVLLGSTPPALQQTVVLSVTSGSVIVSGFTIVPAMGVTSPGELQFHTTPPAGATITPASPLSLVLDFAPTAEHTTGTLGQVMFSDGTNMLTLPILTGSYTGSIGTVPAALDFGTVCVGSTPPTKQLEVYANASGDVQIKADITLPGPPFTPMLSESLPATLGGFHSGPSLFITTMLDTSTAGTMAATDQIVLDTNIPGATPKRSIPVTATVLPAGIGASPTALAFVALKIKSTSPPQIVTLTNCGSDVLMVNDTKITGANPDDFAATPLVQTLPATLNPTDKMMFVVQTTPAGVGPRVAQLQIDHSAGTTSVDLSATGVGDDRKTYYACSAGGPAGLAPLALVLAFALRRRRR